MKRILFLDDGQRVFDGLARKLHLLCGQWQMVFANSGQQALELVSQLEFDLPGIGSRLLEMKGQAAFRGAGAPSTGRQDRTDAPAGMPCPAVHTANTQVKGPSAQDNEGTVTAC